MEQTKILSILRKEKGSLALEQVLFIGAIVLLAGGLTAFYTNLSDYFTGVSFTSPSTVGIGGSSGSTP